MHGADDGGRVHIPISADDPGVRDNAIEHLLVRVADGEGVVRADKRAFERDAQHVLQYVALLFHDVASGRWLQADHPDRVQIHPGFIYLFLYMYVLSVIGGDGRN